MFPTNSLILEGKVIGEPEFVKTHATWCSIKIESNTSAGSFQVKAEGYGNVAEMMKKWLKEGSKIRVVGKLYANSDSGTFIIIEHLEVKPDKKSE